MNICSPDNIDICIPDRKNESHYFACQIQEENGHRMTIREHLSEKTLSAYRLTVRMDLHTMYKYIYIWWLRFQRRENKGRKLFI
jgi:hypothetical protein